MRRCLLLASLMCSVAWSQLSARAARAPDQDESRYAFFLPMLATPGGLRGEWAFDFRGVRPSENDRCSFQSSGDSLSGRCLHGALTGTMSYPYVKWSGARRAVSIEMDGEISGRVGVQQITGTWWTADGTRMGTFVARPTPPASWWPETFR